MTIKTLKDVLNDKGLTDEQVKALLIALYCLKEIAIVNEFAMKLNKLVERCNEFDKVKTR